MEKIDYGKVVSFLLVTFGLGLLQLWVLTVYLLISDQSPAMAIILKDGGLYFFSTSLAFSSLQTLLFHKSLKIGSKYFNMSVVCIAPVSLIAIVALVVIRGTSHKYVESQFSDHILSQLTCLILAGIYATFVFSEVGYLKRKKEF